MLRSYQRFHEYYSQGGEHPIVPEYEQAVYALLQTYGVEIPTDIAGTIMVDIQTVDAHSCRIEIDFTLGSYHFWCFDICLDKERHLADRVQNWFARVRNSVYDQQVAEGPLWSVILAYKKLIETDTTT